MTLAFIPAENDPRREIIYLDGKIVGDITPNALGAGGWVHCFGRHLPQRLAARSWPQWARTRDEAHALIQEAITA